MSPRVVCVVGSAAQATEAAQELARALTRLARELPPGPRHALEEAEQRRHRDAAAYAFELFDAGGGWVSVSESLVLPPAYRNLHVFSCEEPGAALRPWSAHLTTLAANDEGRRARLRAAFPGARVAPLGQMQRPPLDGPVDLRRGTQGELIAGR